MKIYAYAVLGLSFFGLVKGNLGALKSTQIATLGGHDENILEAVDVSDFKRRLPPYVAAPDFDIALNDESPCVFTLNPDGSDIGSITCTFTADGGVGHSISSAVYDEDCENPAPAYVVQDTSPITILDTTDNKFSTYEVTVYIANSAIETDANACGSCYGTGDVGECCDTCDSVRQAYAVADWGFDQNSIWQCLDDYDLYADSGRKVIQFCLKAEVKDKSGDVYDWIGQKFALTVDFYKHFTTGSLTGLTTTKAFDGNVAKTVQAGYASYTVSVFRCDSNGDRASDTALSLGDNLYICVKGDQSGLLINDIVNLYAQVEGVNPNFPNPNTNPSPVVYQTLVEEMTAVAGTFVYGRNTNKLVVATRFTSNFFETEGIVSLNGEVNIAYGASQSTAPPGASQSPQPQSTAPPARQLVRIMQEALPLESTADFSIEVALKSSGAFSTSMFGAAIVFGAVAALVL